MEPCPRRQTFFVCSTAAGNFGIAIPAYNLTQLSGVAPRALIAAYKVWQQQQHQKQQQLF
jgi:hypothetical protein